MLSLDYIPIKYLKIAILICIFFLFSVINYKLGKQDLFDDKVDKLTFLDAMYYTTVTLTSIGYGDITPKTQKAKAICMTQMIVFWIFMYYAYNN